MTEPRDRLPELLVAMRQHQRATRATRSAVACGVLICAVAAAWLAMPASQPQKRDTSVIAHSTPEVPSESPPHELQPLVRVVTTEDVLRTTTVEIRTIAPSGLAMALRRDAPCYRLIRTGDVQRLVYSCR